MVSKNQRLSENFIREFQNNVEWNKISRYQDLSEDFIRELKDKLNWQKIKCLMFLMNSPKISFGSLSKFLS